MSSTPTLALALALTAGAVAAGALLASRSRRASEPPPPPMTRDEFKEHFAAIKGALVAEAKARYEMPAHAQAHIDRMLEYTVPGGKVNRGMTVVSVVESLRPDLVRTAEQRRSVAALGWTIELMQASFLVADDMMDSSITRRGAPCWYLVPGVGKTAINDSLLLLTQVDLALTRYVRASSPSVVAALRDLLADTTYCTELGQLLDLTTQVPGADIDLSKYTLDRYKQIVKYKTAFYTFVAPVQLGLVYCGVTDRGTVEAAKRVCLEMGEYFQIQDDVLDCYGLPEVIGKIGTDIQDGKCSWLVCQALTRASPADLDLLRADYGKADDACVARVKGLFKRLDLQAVFDAYEADAVAKIRAQIDAVEDERVVAVLSGVLGLIYKRLK